MAAMVLTHDDILDVVAKHPTVHRPREGNDLVPAPACDGRPRLNEWRELTLAAMTSRGVARSAGCLPG